MRTDAIAAAGDGRRDQERVRRTDKLGGLRMNAICWQTQSQESVTRTLRSRGSQPQSGSQALPHLHGRLGGRCPGRPPESRPVGVPLKCRIGSRPVTGTGSRVRQGRSRAALGQSRRGHMKSAGDAGKANPHPPPAPPSPHPTPRSTKQPRNVQELLLSDSPIRLQGVRAETVRVHQGPLRIPHRRLVQCSSSKPTDCTRGVGGGRSQKAASAQAACEFAATCSSEFSD